MQSVTHLQSTNDMSAKRTDRKSPTAAQFPDWSINFYASGNTTISSTGGPSFYFQRRGRENYLLSTAGQKAKPRSTSSLTFPTGHFAIYTLPDKPWSIESPP
jgi:hypothetical protein